MKYEWEITVDGLHVASGFGNSKEAAASVARTYLMQYAEDEGNEFNFVMKGELQ